MLTAPTPALALALALTAGACGSSAAMADTTSTTTSSALSASISPVTSSASLAVLSSEEADGLLFMREEEKLAHDVYVTLDELWGLTIFENIAAAEQSHMDSVVTLLDRYGLTDPAADLAVGSFSDPALQSLYDDLVARGSESEVDALLAGALIEELDITDLQARASDNEDIASVYAELERGSRNHLRAFVRQLDRLGVTYEPEYLSDEAFLDITTSETERGNGETGGHGSGNGAGQGHGAGAGRGGGNGMRVGND